MRTKPIGTSGITASSLCFGCMQFGGNADQAESAALYAACREAGIDFFDNAWVYNDGRSEEALAPLIAPEREKVIVTSKVAYKGGAGAANIRAQAEESLKRLQSDYVDILFLHVFNEEPLEESFAELAKLRDEGKLKTVGVSNFAAWQVMKAQSVAAQFDLRIDIIQPMYSLVKRTAEIELLPMAQAENIAVIPYSPLGGGVLTGKYGSGGTGRLDEISYYKRRYQDEAIHQAAASFAALAQENNVHPATLAVAWAAAHPGITAPIISARSVEQLTPSLAAATYTLSSELYQKVTALTATPPPPTDRTEGAHEPAELKKH